MKNIFLSQLATKDAAIASKDAEIASMNAEIARLTAFRSEKNITTE